MLEKFIDGGILIVPERIFRCLPCEVIAYMDTVIVKDDGPTFRVLKRRYQPDGVPFNPEQRFPIEQMDEQVSLGNTREERDRAFADWSARNPLLRCH